ncbi:MAG: histidinol dehydrogenase [Ignavibacteriae bacterium HGW-Ignavibacteriae-2]|nr:MAG: histidinol dehydrogenase [Ignavibacteriae bacterium HGW-Ignavibacteriae-2]
MKIYEYNKLTEKEISLLLKRPAIDLDSTFKIVKPILKEIKEQGLKKVYEYAEKFDGLIDNNIRVTSEEFDDSSRQLKQEKKDAINAAAENIKRFHEKQLPKNYSIETQPGVICSREFRAIENVGLYIPGGTAVLPSTVLMLGIPANLAGCLRIIACSPAKEKIDPAVLYAARVAGIDEFYKVGGAQAIAMMAYGNEEISKVDKIFGPGNQFVTAAKILVNSDPDGCLVDMPAGPSEVLIIADKYADASFIASDLLSQAEHGKDSQVILLADDKKLIDDVLKEIDVQKEYLPRKEYVEQCLNSSYALLINSISDGIIFSNKYAPEHLILNVDQAESYVDKIINAGSVFIGAYSPESAGDYASGTNHSLPTYGYAKSIGGVSVEMFMKAITFQNLTKSGLEKISQTVIQLAETEKLLAHANAIRVRLK